MLLPTQWKLLSLYRAFPRPVFFLRPSWSAASLSRVERRGKDRPRKSLARVGRLNGRNIERKSEREKDSSRIFTTGPLINTHWVTGCLLCRNWALGALYPPFTIWTYPRKSLSGMVRNRSLFPVYTLLSFFLDARTFPGLLQMMTRSSVSSFCTWIEDVSCTKVH